MFATSTLPESRKRLITNVVAGLILLVMFLVAFFSSRGIFGDPGDSGTVDEIAHIPSGFTYVKDADFRLNPEHPPLAKALAGLPLALKGFVGPENDWSWTQINQWEAGWYMLYETSNNPAQLLLWARVPMMLLMIGLGLFVFKWAKELYGRKTALIVLALFASYPDVIAHGRLVTTDVAAALGYVVTLYYFDKAIANKTTKSIAIAGLAFGLAQLLKFSSFLLFGVLFILVLARAYQERREGFGTRFIYHFKTFFWVCVISLILVWLVYIPFVWNTPARIEHEVIINNLTADPRNVLLRNFLHFFEDNPITRALGHYLLGVMLVIKRVEGGNATFLIGQVAEKSIPLFFPIAWLVKTPLTIIALVAWATGYLLIKRQSANNKGWLLWVILTPVVVYWLFTLRGALNIGIRHLMPTIPFILLLIGYLINQVKTNRWQFNLIIVLLVFQIAHTLSYFPNYIGYFNNFVPRDERYKYLIDSSLDWGQDMLRLKKYVDENTISEIKIDYFGGSVPAYYIPQYREWHSSYGPTTGWMAISATYLQSSKLYGPKEGKWSYDWLANHEPKAIIGGSILVYNITQQDLINRPATSPYPITKLEFPGMIQTEIQKVGL